MSGQTNRYQNRPNRAARARQALQPTNIATKINEAFQADEESDLEDPVITTVIDGAVREEAKE